jgi:uncharacterized protein (DUF433 family)
MMASETMFNWTKRITMKPSVRSGKPCVKGTRITVFDVLGWLASGMKEKDILHDYPQLEEDDIRACLAFAADWGRRVQGPAA